MKKFLNKLADICKWIFGYGIMICVFAGGLTFFGYLVALCIGGQAAADICTFLYKTVMPYIIRTATIMVLLGLVTMYLSGQTALTASKKKDTKK